MKPVYVTKKKKRKVKKRKPPLGSGARFAALEQDLQQKGVRDPAALAASIGRKRYGNARFAALSRKGR